MVLALFGRPISDPEEIDGMLTCSGAERSWDTLQIGVKCADDKFGSAERLLRLDKEDLSRFTIIVDS